MNYWNQSRQSWNRFVLKTAEALELTLLSAMTDRSNYLLLPYPINFWPLIDNKEPFCSSAESSPVNHLLTGSYTNAKSPLQGVFRVHLLRYHRIPVWQLVCHYTGEDRPSLGFCNRIRHSLYDEKLANEIYYYLHHVFFHL